MLSFDDSVWSGRQEIPQKRFLPQLVVVAAFQWNCELNQILLQSLHGQNINAENGLLNAIWDAVPPHYYLILNDRLGPSNVGR